MSHNGQRQHKDKTVDFGSQFEYTVHYGAVMKAGLVGHILSSGRRHRDECSEWYGYIQMVFLPQLNISGNILTDVPRDVFSR
jgi:hypothetical protein